MKFIDGKTRCDWIKDHLLYLQYHDEEWGLPIYDDHKLFELLVLESAEAGLSWLTILKKRANYRLAYDNFDPEKVACYDSTKEEQLLMNAGIIRSKAKIISSIEIPSVVGADLKAAAALGISAGYVAVSAFAVVMEMVPAELAVVVRRSPRPNQPFVVLISKPDGELLPTPRLQDPAASGIQIRAAVAASVIIGRLPFSG